MHFAAVGGEAACFEVMFEIEKFQRAVATVHEAEKIADFTPGKFAAIPTIDFFLLREGFVHFFIKLNGFGGLMHQMRLEVTDQKVIVTEATFCVVAGLVLG